MSWRDVKFTEVAQLINGRAYSQPELLDSGKYRVVRVGNLSGGDRWFFSDLELDENKYCNKGDLLFSWACNFGPYIWEKEKTIFHYHIWKLILEEEKINKSFFYYYLKYKTPYMLGNVNGSVMVHITKGTMEKQILSIPDLSQQQKIASILSSLDAKIENNNKINANLEAQAQALFKSWFVDFEPFQDGEFEDSELGRIPKGWKVGTLGELIEVKYGKDHKRLPDGDIPVYGSGGLMRKVDRCLYNGESVLIPRKGTLNNVMYVNEAFWTVDTMFYSIMKQPRIAIFVYQFLIRKDLASMNAGSAVPSMTSDILNKMEIVIPPQSILVDFDIIVQSLYKKKQLIKAENETLSLLRDTLLPKLMSGEIEV